MSERTYPKPSMPMSHMAIPWHIYERDKEAPKYGEFKQIWHATGFAAYGLDQANWLKTWLEHLNPDYEYLVSK